MHNLAILFMKGGGWLDDYSHFIHKAKEVGPQCTKRDNSRHKGGRLTKCMVTVLQTNKVGSWR